VTLRVVWTDKAERSVRRLDRETISRLHRSVVRLAETGQGDLVRLKPPLNSYRLRVGDWRVFLDLDSATETIIVQDVRPWSNAYSTP
jgi:mRNA-degrading endonuclease RelE of RelBE toxin-antitoxin system